MVQMKRALTIAVVLTLVVAATGFAGTRTYRGAIESDDTSSIAVKVKRNGGEAEVKAFVAKQFQITCDNGPATLARAAISGVIPVNDKNRFEIEGSDGGRVLKIAGKLIGKRAAAGSMRYSGPTAVDGEIRECDTRKLRWKAGR